MQERRTQIVLVAAAVFIVVVGLVLIGLAIAGGAAPPPTPTPTPTSPPTVVPATAVPTSTPIPPTPTPEPTALPSPTPIPTDPQGDVTGYDGGPPIEDAPAGVDIRMASIYPNMGLMLQDTTGAPAELQALAVEGDALFWITLHEPIPSPPEQDIDWLFALDLDGDAATGRPVDSARINPDIGMEVAIAVYYSAAEGVYDAYYLIWSPAQGGFAPQTADIRFVVSDSRFAVGLAIPLATLTQDVADVAGVTVVPEAARGRAAVVAGAAQRVIDFYPDRPD
jgi:hypothetical protein